MTQLKVLVSNPANDWDFPLKVFGIAVVFAGLMYMLFAHSDVVRENIVLGVNKVRRYFGKEDIVYNKKSDETNTSKSTTPPKTSTQRRRRRQRAAIRRTEMDPERVPARESIRSTK